MIFVGFFCFGWMLLELVLALKCQDLLKEGNNLIELMANINEIPPSSYEHFLGMFMFRSSKVGLP